jgi:hypothetical protein
MLYSVGQRVVAAKSIDLVIAGLVIPIGTHGVISEIKSVKLLPLGVSFSLASVINIVWVDANEIAPFTTATSRI